MKNLNSFKTPNNYFNDLETKILNQTVHTKKERTIFSLKKVFPYGIAASVLLVASVFWFQQNETIQEQKKEQVSEVLYETYFLDNPYESELNTYIDEEVAYNGF
ncbi:MAG: hypothetical protein H6604_08835 [Flavobacteriales bacterium]|nr:hypothetical protein [Flavobacteriales bacterium]